MGCCKCIGGMCLNIFVWLCHLVLLGCSVAIICIVAIQLTDVQWNTNNINEIFTAQCLLSYNDGMWGTSMCNYAYAVCGLSIVVSAVVSIVLCCTCQLCGLGFIIETIFSAVGTAWWLAASLVFSSAVKTANDNDPPGVNWYQWRDAVVILSWGACGLFALVFIIYLVKMLAKCCSCCGCCGDDDEKESSRV